MPSVISASRRDRKIGQVPLFGLSRVISSGLRANRTFGFARSAGSRTKNAKSIAASRAAGPVTVSRQNFIRLSTAVNSGWRFSKSYSDDSDEDSTRSRKKCCVVASVAIPVGAIIPARPCGPISIRSVSAKTA